MGVTIQFESHRVELAFVPEMEHDPTVLEYYDQPPSFPLDYRTAKGHHLRVVHTPDFFVMREGAAGWEECKVEEELHRLSERRPRRYCQDEHGSWHCPPGEGIRSPIRLVLPGSSTEINRVVQRNLQFLEDYLGTPSGKTDLRSRDWGLALVSADAGYQAVSFGPERAQFVTIFTP